jgi:hypothetical protein
LVARIMKFVTGQGSPCRVIIFPTGGQLPA